MITIVKSIPHRLTTELPSCNLFTAETSTRDWICRDMTTNSDIGSWNKLKMISLGDCDDDDDGGGGSICLEQFQKALEISAAEQTLDCILYDFPSQLYIDKETRECFVLAEVKTLVTKKKDALNNNNNNRIGLFHGRIPLGCFTKIVFPPSSHTPVVITQVVIVSPQVHLFLDHQHGKSYARWLSSTPQDQDQERMFIIEELNSREGIHRVLLQSGKELQSQMGFLHGISSAGVLYRWNYSFYSLCWEEIGRCFIKPEEEDPRCIPVFQEYDLDVDSLDSDSDSDPDSSCSRSIPFKIIPDRYHYSPYLGIWFAIDSVIPSRIIFGCPFFDVDYPLEDDENHQDQIFQAGKCQWIDPSSVYKTSTTIRFYVQQFKFDIRRIYYQQQLSECNSLPLIFSPVEPARILLELSTGNRVWMNCSISVVTTGACDSIKKYYVWFEDAEYEEFPKVNHSPSPPPKKKQRGV